MKFTSKLTCFTYSIICVQDQHYAFNMSNRQYLNGGDYYGNLGLYFPQYLGNTFI